MKRKNVLAAIALILMLAAVLCACGSKTPSGTPDTTEALKVTEAPDVPGSALGLASWEMSATTWSSPNGATIHITAVPTGDAEGQSAVFCVRLDGSDVETVPCQWDGKAYTASAELNAADGYSYYVILTGADGATAEVAVNTPDAVTEEAFVNMATALNSYCTATVDDSGLQGSKLTVYSGSVQVQAPTITNDNQAITCSKVQLVLYFNDKAVSSADLTVVPGEIPGSFTAELKDLEFDAPAMEDDQQLVMTLEVTLSNGQTLFAPAGTWLFSNSNLLSAVG